MRCNQREAKLTGNSVSANTMMADDSISNRAHEILSTRRHLRRDLSYGQANVDNNLRKGTLRDGCKSEVLFMATIWDQK